jgi:hypothetical protein
MTTTIGDIISRVRNQLKAVNKDAFLTDRFIYSIILKHSHWLMKREDSKNKLMRFKSVIQTIPSVELIEVNKVEACCTNMYTDCKIKRSKDKLPTFLQGYYGPLISAVMSVDGSTVFMPTDPKTWVAMTHSTTFKYNKTKYYWYLDGYLYFPDLEWEAVRVDGIFEDSIEGFNCDKDDVCTPRQDELFNVPDYLHGELETYVMKDFGMVYQIPPDVLSDKQNLLR